MPAPLRFVTFCRVCGRRTVADGHDTCPDCKAHPWYRAGRILRTVGCLLLTITAVVVCMGLLWGMVTLATLLLGEG